MKVLLLVTGFLAFSFTACSPGVQDVKALKDPQVRSQKALKVLVYEIQGDPNETTSKAFSALYKTYYKLKNAKVTGVDSTPRARWPLPYETPREKWIGQFALPVADSVMEIPKGADPRVKLERWEYGQIGEILHEGPYRDEKPTVDRLKAFLKSQGLEIKGPHEEIYLKSAGMFFKGDEKKYLTLIRYPVGK